MKNTWFRFKQFTIQQDRCSMKVGTDGVLLGAWADIENANSLLDIGTGTGLLALMTAQRNSHLHIEAIEIEEKAFQQARENIINSPWSNRIQVFNVSLFDFYPEKRYDCIVCNPPFFINSTKNPNQDRTLARHTDSLPHDRLVQKCSQLLTSQGCLCVILPVTEAKQFTVYARKSQLYPAKITHILPNPGKPPKRCLIKYICQEVIPQREEFVLELSRHQYSTEYQTITREFYLNL